LLALFRRQGSNQSGELLVHPWHQLEDGLALEHNTQSLTPVSSGVKAAMVRVRWKGNLINA
jgi:hypothetical protein